MRLTAEGIKFTVAEWKHFRPKSFKLSWEVWGAENGNAAFYFGCLRHYLRKGQGKLAGLAFQHIVESQKTMTAESNHLNRIAQGPEEIQIAGEIQELNATHENFIGVLTSLEPYRIRP